MLTGCTEDEAGTVTLNLTVNDFTPGETAAPVPNAEVCVLDTEDCTTTDADGLAVVALPSNAETGVTITANGFNPTVLAQTTDANFLSDQTTTLLSEAIATTLAALLEIDYPPVGAGVIALTTVFPLPEVGGIPGTTLDLTDGTGTGYYVTADGIPTYDLMASSSFGGGGFVEVAPGIVEIDIGGSPGGCGVAQAWPGTTATRVRLPVQDGFFTSSLVYCETVGVNPTVLGAEEPFGDSVPLEGAEVCQDGTDNCSTTDADGVAALQIPGNEEFAYAVTPPSGFFPLLSPQVSDSDIPLSPNLTVFSDVTLGAFAALLDTEFPPTTGTIGMVVDENPFPDAVGIPGVSFELIEGTGRSYYLDEANLPDAMLTETVDGGSGGFVEASEGTLEVGLSGAQNCERPYNAWPGAEPNQFRFPSRAGFLTVPVVWCDAEVTP
jgi:hypothetical protein